MDAYQFVPILVVGFATALGLTPVSRTLALRLGVVDKPNQRKIHRDHKPLMGGLAIFAGFALALLLFSPEQHVAEFSAIVGGAALLALVGLLDDRFMLGVKVRLLAQTAAAVVLLLVGVQVRLFGVAWLDVPITLVWIVALTNALNFLDNMDGQAAGVAAIAALWFTLIGFNEQLALVSAIAAAIAGSAVGFLTYNFNPASTFMGDMGALVLGFVLATLGIKLEFGAQPLNVTWMVPILVLGMPIFDICLVVFTRLREGRSPFEGGKDHSSHRLMSLGLSQRQTILLIYAACALYGLLGFGISVAPPPLALALGAAGLAGMAGLFALMMWIRREKQLKV
jgi:UDP-GlcNAc:undecaprenyl-phosphate GlcNAc-1-phosphate transferase